MSAPAPTIPPEESTSGKLSWGVKLAYGGPGFAGAAMAIPIGIFMPVFYSDVVLAPLGMIALATAIARALDALTDPVVGWLSDKTRTRYGRRKPWILAGTPLAALFFWLLFSPPEGLDPSSAVLWFGTMFALFFLFQTIEGVPLAALGAELTPDYKERNSVFGVRALFIALGTMVAALVPAILTGQLGPGHEREIFSGMSATYGIVWLVLMCIMLAAVSEHREYAERPTNPLVPGVRRALRNRPFAILLLSGVVGAIPGAVPAVLMPYFVRYVLQPEDPVVWIGTFLFLYLGTGLLFVPLWLWVAQKFGKLRAFISATCVGVSASLLYFFAGPGDLAWAGAVYFVSGTQAMAGTFLIPAMAADVIDYDELRTGLRREAQYTSFWSVIPKLVSIPGYSIPLALLAGVGYVPNEIQTAEVQFTISFLYSLFPAAFFVVALLIISRYPHFRGGSRPDPRWNRCACTRGCRDGPAHAGEAAASSLDPGGDRRGVVPRLFLRRRAARGAARRGVGRRAEGLFRHRARPRGLRRLGRARGCGCAVARERPASALRRGRRRCGFGVHRVRLPRDADRSRAPIGGGDTFARRHRDAPRSDRELVAGH